MPVDFLNRSRYVLPCGGDKCVFRDASREFRGACDGVFVGDVFSRKERVMQMWKRVMLVGLVAAVTPFVSGCFMIVAAGGAAAGTVAYVRGELKVTLDKGMKDCREATARAIDSLKLQKISETGDAVVAEFKAQNAQGENIVIKLDRLSDDATQARIRIGNLGDQNMSHRILDEIKGHL